MIKMNFDSSVERMKELMGHGKDEHLKPNVSETIEYKIAGPDDKTYGVSRERQKYYIKESLNGTDFNYIGGIGNKSEFEYSSYNSAVKNLELLIREKNEANNVKKIFEVNDITKKEDYVVEATEDMRNEINRQREIMQRVAGILHESKPEFINKPTFKDPEAAGKATDPKKQGQPFEKEAKPELDTDPTNKSVKPETQGDPFEGDVKVDPTKMDIETTNSEPCKAGDPFVKQPENVPDNSVANQHPKGGKVFKVTEAQMNEIRKMMSEEVAANDEKMDENIQKSDSDVDTDENDLENRLVSKVTEAILNAFGQHPGYQKIPFTTPPATAELKPGTHEWDDESVKTDKPFGEKIGDSAPFTEPVNEEGDEIAKGTPEQKGETQPGMAKLGEKGDTQPFDTKVTPDGDEIAKGTPEQKGKTQPSIAKGGEKGDTKPFSKDPKKSDLLNKLAESILSELKKKV